jgi:hypothetical protein
MSARLGHFPLPIDCISNFAVDAPCRIAFLSRMGDVAMKPNPSGCEAKLGLRVRNFPELNYRIAGFAVPSHTTPRILMTYTLIWSPWVRSTACAIQ